jgi:hypothetical protein
MRNWVGRRRQALVALALLALACLAVALLAASFLHSHGDGVFDTDCVACLSSATLVAVSTASIPIPSVLERIGFVSIPHALSVHEAAYRVDVSRGPPAP